MEKSAKAFAPQSFLNRELSWLEFNQRVLDEALNAGNPLLERVKFFAIVSSNLDEFFEVRVAGVKQQMESDYATRGNDGRTPEEVLRAIRARTRVMVADHGRCWREKLVPALATVGINLWEFANLPPTDQAWAADYFIKQVEPVLTPLGLDPAHPFPQLLNKTLNLIVQLEVRKGKTREQRLAVVQVPRVLPRLVRLPRTDARQDYILLSRLIGHHLASIFSGNKILGYWQFRVTRNSELYIDEEDAANLLKAVEQELHKRRRGDAVRLEVEQSCPAEMATFLLENLHLTEDDLFRIDGLLNPTQVMMLCDDNHLPELRDPPFLPPRAAAVPPGTDLFAVIRQRDVLLHHPYQSFDTVVEFLQQAARDPQVLAIKQTLYRTGGDPRIVGALMEAVNNGKQVAAVVELKARFDEANNIQWARQLEEAGVHVVYGLVGFKIHCKLTMVVRHDEDGIRRYLHLSSGNYNASTSKFYTDVGLLTSRPAFGEDVSNVFNLLTGVCQFPGTRKLLVAPFQLHARLLELVEREQQNAERGLPARIILKMNSLVDRESIEALYRASGAGVRIELIVRGICCLRPGVPGLSENIRVVSIVDRYLEHSRIYYFENACQPEVFVGSADWMPRNFFSRVEVVFPIEDGNLRDRIIHEVLGLSLQDNVKARQLQPDGSYLLLQPGPKETPVRSQTEFMTLALRDAPKTGHARSLKTSLTRLKLRPKPVGTASTTST
jgi:polyphosphate kinase